MTSTINFKLSARTEKRVAMQGRSPSGAGLGVGVEYTRIDEGEIWGPYLTGCADGRQCYEAPMASRIYGDIVRVNMEKTADTVLCHYRAEDLVMVDGEVMGAWQDRGPLDMELSNNLTGDTEWTYQATGGPNGGPAVCRQPVFNDFYGEVVGLGYGGLASSRIGVELDQLTAYVVMHRADSWLLAWGVVEDTYAGRLSSSFIPSSYHASYINDMFFSRNHTFFYYDEHEQCISGYSSGVMNQGAFPLGWGVYAYRFGNPHSTCKSFLNGVHDGVDWSLYWDEESANTPVPAFTPSQYPTQINIGFMGNASQYDQRYAEIIVDRTAHSDDEMIAKSQELMAKYGI